MECSYPICSESVRARGLCWKHYQRWRRHGDVETVKSPLRREAHQGTGGITPQGYRILYRPNHPAAMKSGYVLEHRMVMSDLLGRALRPGETVHHKNGRKTDNRVTNLELWITTQPAGQRVQDLVAWAREILDSYADLP